MARCEIDRRLGHKYLRRLGFADLCAGNKTQEAEECQIGLNGAGPKNHHRIYRLVSLSATMLLSFLRT